MCLIRYMCRPICVNEHGDIADAFSYRIVTVNADSATNMAKNCKILILLKETEFPTHLNKKRICKLAIISRRCLVTFGGCG